MEILDLFDINGNHLNKTMVRASRPISDGEYIKIVTIWIKCKNKFLIQKTSEAKHNEYAVSGGHVPTGTTPIEQAVIELDEELGIKITTGQLSYLGRVVRGHVLFETYLLEDDNFDTYPITLQETEVEDVLWLNSSEIEYLINKSDFRESSAMQYDKFIRI